MWVVTQEYPASLTSLASQSMCFDMDAILSGDSEVGGSNALRASPVLIFNQDIAVISMHSSDSDPDSSDECCMSDSPIEPVLPVPTSISVHVVESPSHYPAPAEPVVLLAASSMLISPNLIREDCSSVTLDVYQVYEVSLDTTGYIPATAPVTPPSSEVSLPAPVPEQAPVSGGSGVVEWCGCM